MFIRTITDIIYHCQTPVKDKSIAIYQFMMLLCLLVCCSLVYAESKQAAPIEKVSLQLKWLHAFQFAGYYAAKEKGFYAEAGLDVDIRQRILSINNIEQVIKGNSEYGVADSSLLLDRLIGKPVVVLASIFQHNPLVYFTLKSSDIVSAIELKDKRVMDNVFDRSALLAMLYEANVPLDKIHHVDQSVNNDDLINGKVDATVGYLTNELDYYRQKKIDVNIIDPRNYGVDFLGDNLFTTEQEIKQHPDRTQRFVRASLKGWDYALKHPDEIIALILKKYNSDKLLSERHLRFEASETAKMIVADSIPLGSTSTKRFQRIADIYQQLGLVKSLDRLDGFIYQPNEQTTLNLSAEEKAWLQAHPVIRLGIDKDFAPYESIDDKGNYLGLSAEYVNLVEQRLGVKFEVIKDKTWVQMLDMAKHNKVDIISDINKTPERDTYLNFTEPYIETPAIIINHEKNGFLRDLKSLHDKRVAIEKGYFLLERLSTEHPNIQLVTADNTLQAFNMINDGAADAYIGDAAAANYTIRKSGMISLMYSGDTGYKSSHRMAATKQHPVLVNILNKALNSISDVEKQTIQHRWMSLKAEAWIDTKTLVQYALTIVVFFCLVLAWNMSLQRQIKRRKRVENALRDSENRLRTIIENNPECIKIVSAEGYLLDMNPAGLTMIEADSRQQVIGRRVLDLISPKYRAAFIELHKRVIAGEVMQLEFEIQGLKGGRCWMETHAVPIQEQGVTAHLAVTRNISKRKIAETALKQLLQLQELLMEIATTYINLPLDIVDSSIQVSLGKMGEFVKADRVYIFNYDFNKQLTNNTHEWCAKGITPKIGNLQQVPLTLIADWVNIHQHGESVYIADVAALPAGGLHELLDAQAIKSLLSFPLIHEHECLGFVGFDSVQQHRQYSDNERYLLTMFAQMLVNVEQRKKVGKSLASSENKYRTLIELAGDAIFLAELTTGIVLDCNLKATKLIGKSKQEIIGLHQSQLHPLEKTEIYKQLFEHAIQQNKETLENVLVAHKDGHTIPVDISCSTFELDNSIVVLGVFHDISERKQAEKNLRIAATVFEAQEGMLITDVNQVILNVNKAFTEITGYSADEVIGQSPRLLSSGYHDSNFYRLLWQSINQTGTWQGEIWNRRKNGDIYPVWLTITAVKANNDDVVSHYVATLTDVTERKATEEYINHLAFYDSLTQLPNRRLLHERIKHGMTVCHREASQMAVLILDLDKFKAVNDNLGHSAGDELLQQVAQRIHERLRDTETLARLGGDEFVILIEEVRHYADVSRIATDIIEAMSQPFIVLNSHQIYIGTSIGISIYPEHGQSMEALMDNADIALYHAKDNGRGCFAYFSEELTQKARARIALEVRLRHAIEQQELQVYFQPQISLQSGKIIGAEALVRWHDTGGACILPSEFISLAEETGLIVDIGEWVLRETCKQGQQWLNQGLPPLILAVNVSPHQFRRCDIQALVTQILEETGFPAHYLELEITESGLMENQQHALPILNSIHAQGVRLAIDDFGTGYSSLAYLKHFPLDVLKIDKTFIDDIPFLTGDRAITATIIAMAHHLGFKVLAEGVETPEQLAFLEKQGCDYYQGYLYSEALPVNTFTVLLRETDFTD